MKYRKIGYFDGSAIELWCIEMACNCTVSDKIEIQDVYDGT